MLQMKRRDFLVGSIYSIVGISGLSVLTAGCGSSGAAYGGNTANNVPPAVGGNCASHGVVPTIELLHDPNHTLSIPAADVAAGIAKTYTLEDNGTGHTHEVTLSAADFASLQRGQGIQEMSTLTGHIHSVTVNCG